MRVTFTVIGPDAVSIEQRVRAVLDRLGRGPWEASARLNPLTESSDGGYYTQWEATVEARSGEERP